MTREEIHKLPWEAQEYINSLQRQNGDLKDDLRISNIDYRKQKETAESIAGKHIKDIVELNALKKQVEDYEQLKKTIASKYPHIVDGLNEALKK